MIGFEEHKDCKMNSENLESATNIVKQYVESEKIPGVVSLVAQNGKILSHKYFGFSQIMPHKEVMTLDTLFDLASLTKPIITATSIMILVDRGLINLNDTASKFIEELYNTNRQNITIKELLTHTSGLPDWRALYLNGKGYSEIINEVIKTELQYKPSSIYIYSDLGYILLGEIIRKITNKELFEFAYTNILQPLYMKDSFFNPNYLNKNRCAATEFSALRNGVVKGEVHDNNAYYMGGISGHAGLFSTAKDLFYFCQMLLNKGTFNNIKILSSEAIENMTKNAIKPLGYEGLGFFIKGNSSSKDYSLSDDAFGHTGFTGTCFWVDPTLELIIILLTNRVHPTRNNNTHITLRREFINKVVSILTTS
jgi:CubicO group peptidase (beta-lactamase class C family)